MLELDKHILAELNNLIIENDVAMANMKDDENVLKSNILEEFLKDKNNVKTLINDYTGFILFTLPSVAKGNKDIIRFSNGGHEFIHKTQSSKLEKNIIVKELIETGEFKLDDFRNLLELYNEYFFRDINYINDYVPSIKVKDDNIIINKRNEDIDYFTYETIISISKPFKMISMYLLVLILNNHMSTLTDAIKKVITD